MAMRTPTITIAGLGPGDPASRTLAVQRALDEAQTIVLRTSIHPGIADLVSDARVVACDDIYEQCDSFAEIYQKVVDRVLVLAKRGPVVYALPGSPHFGEKTVPNLLDRAKAAGLTVEVLPGVSALEPVSAATRIDLLNDEPHMLDALQITSTVEKEPFSGGMTAIDPSRPLVIGQVFNRRTASEIKHALSRMYPESHFVFLISAAGMPEQRVERRELAEIDHQEPDHLTTLIVPPLAPLDAFRSPSTLFRIIARLRSPDGCPWDRKQTHESLRDKIIEEAHESAEAILEGDPEQLRDELGDLLLLVALCAQIAEEEGTFTIEDVFEAVNTKLIRRHPHVFGDVEANTPEEVLTTWAEVKAAEKPARSAAAPTLRYDQLPRSLSVIERIRRSESAVSAGAAQSSLNLGERLLEMIEGALAAGIDPEAALEQAYRADQIAKLK